MKVKAIIVFSLLLLTAVVSAETDITVGANKMPPLKWGEQTARFDLTNNSDYLKWIAVEIEVQYTGSYLSPSRKTVSFQPAMPEELTEISARLDIPGNYGQAEVKVNMYEVVDTLDDILPYQKFFEQHFFLSAPIPESMNDYLDEEITLPPRVNVHSDFDFEFSRILLKMISEKKSVPEIAKITGAQEDYVNSLISRYQELGYIRGERESRYLSFPFITVAEAEEGQLLSRKLADSLVVIIKNNMPKYDAVFDSLIKAGAVSADSNEFFSRGAVLHDKYSTTGALLLWDKLGKYLITRSAPLHIFDNTDPCHAYIPYYMYAVEGGNFFSGTHYFAMSIKGNGYDIFYGDFIPEINCGIAFKTNRRQRLDHLHYQESEVPEKFMFDSSITNPAINALGAGTESLLNDTYNSLFELAIRYDHPKVSFGYRYWFWNLTATRTLRTLVEQGVLTRRGNGQFQIITMTGL